jgi:hypothetical protein
MATLIERFNRKLFQHAVKGILTTPKIKRGDQAFAALSMVHHRDVQPYLLAIKTFAEYARPERIFVVADPSLTDEDRRILREHIPFLEIVEARDFQKPDLPIGGTWERLSAISVLCQECPIVQLDADTMTFDIPQVVIDAVKANRSFVIRSESGVEIKSLDDTARHGQELLKSSKHIQAIAEARFTELAGWQDYRYVRGCSGFTGFGRGALSPDRLQAVSAAMRRIHGERWNEWGTEQVTSNLLAASAPNAFLLPHPEYCNADGLSSQTRVAHYIGYARHVNRGYEKRARQAIERLRSPLRA